MNNHVLSAAFDDGADYAMKGYSLKNAVVDYKQVDEGFDPISNDELKAFRAGFKDAIKNSDPV